MRALRALLIPLLGLALMGAAKKQPEVTVRFHSEITSGSSEKFGLPVSVSNPSRQTQIGKIPDISELDIKAIYPFPAPDGTLGCAFKLDQHGTLALDTLSIDKRGKVVVAFLNGRQVIDMIIDRRVSDGIITIRRGLTPQEIALLQKKYPTLGAPKTS